MLLRASISFEFHSADDHTFAQDRAGSQRWHCLRLPEYAQGFSSCRCAIPGRRSSDRGFDLVQASPRLRRKAAGIAKEALL